MKGKNYISVILLICFSVLIGHSIVPHHHHHASYSHHECPIDHQEDHSNDKHSSQCHAFNDLVLYKSGLVPELRVISFDCFASSAQDALLPALQILDDIPFPVKVYEPSVLPDASLSRRGPPVLA
jgi:hypothetical protein